MATVSNNPLVVAGAWGAALIMSNLIVVVSDPHIITFLGFLYIKPLLDLTLSDVDDPAVVIAGWVGIGTVVSAILFVAGRRKLKIVLCGGWILLLTIIGSIVNSVDVHAAFTASSAVPFIVVIICAQSAYLRTNNRSGDKRGKRPRASEYSDRG